VRRAEFVRLGVLVLLLAGAAPEPGCAESGSGDEEVGVEVRLTLEREEGVEAHSFAPGEPLGLVLTLRNPGAAPWRRSLPTAQTHDFAVVGSDGRELWRWSAGRMFAQMLGELVLAPGEVRSFRARWSPAPLPAPGSYRARGWIVGDGPGAALELQIGPQGRISTGVPASSRAPRNSISASLTATQPMVQSMSSESPFQRRPSP
jgi:hypothetical protein